MPSYSKKISESSTLFVRSFDGRCNRYDCRCVGTGFISENHTEFADDPATYGKCAEGNETLETSAAVSEARFTRYNEIRKRCKDIQTSAASYGWLLASIKMSWYLRYYGWKKLTAPVIIFQAEKDAFVSVCTMQKFAKKIQRRGKTSCEYVYIPESKHEIFGSDDRTVKAYIERILNFMAK